MLGAGRNGCHFAEARDRHRHVACRRGADAELTRGVTSPCLDRAITEQREAVELSRGDGTDFAPFAHEQRRDTAHVFDFVEHAVFRSRRAAVTQLTIIVEPPCRRERHRGSGGGACGDQREAGEQARGEREQPSPSSKLDATIHAQTCSRSLQHPLWGPPSTHLECTHVPSTRSASSSVPAQK